MNNLTVTGVGCFAGPEKLSRIFLKMVQSYTLGSFNGIESAQDSVTGETESVQLLKALIAGKPDSHGLLDADPGKLPETKKITGFFMTLKDQKLKLSIFAEAEGKRRERHSAVLDALTNMRLKRLN
jgi:hypothetical protein